MIESPRVTVVLALVKLSAGLDGTIGVEVVSSTTWIFPFPFSFGKEVESLDL